MTDLVLHDMDPTMADRLQRLSRARGWSMHDTLHNVLKQGLYACESGADVHFDDREAIALQAAIAAMEGVNDDQGFGLIGRAPDAPPPSHILERWHDD
ncbi:MAG TPA: hypothetical protein VMS49_04710 [Lysobacter sp.]|nr:hypothetical protein [Lysobacter sp.]